MAGIQASDPDTYGNVPQIIGLELDSIHDSRRYAAIINRGLGIQTADRALGDGDIGPARHAVAPSQKPGATSAPTKTRTKGPP